MAATIVVYTQQRNTSAKTTTALNHTSIMPVWPQHTARHDAARHDTALVLVSRFFVSRSEQLRGLKQELCCHRLAQQQAEAFNSRIESFARGPVANNTSYSALRRNPSGLEVRLREIWVFDADLSQ